MWWRMGGCSKYLSLIGLVEARVWSIFSLVRHFRILCIIIDSKLSAGEHHYQDIQCLTYTSPYRYKIVDSITMQDRWQAIQKNEWKYAFTFLNSKLRKCVAKISSLLGSFTLFKQFKNHLVPFVIKDSLSSHK